MAGKKRIYSESYRREAGRLASLPDRTAADVARELGIHVGQIYNWRPLAEDVPQKTLDIISHKT